MLRCCKYVSMLRFSVWSNVSKHTFYRTTFYVKYIRIRILCTVWISLAYFCLPDQNKIPAAADRTPVNLSLSSHTLKNIPTPPWQNRCISVLLTNTQPAIFMPLFSVLPYVYTEFPFRILRRSFVHLGLVCVYWSACQDGVKAFNSCP